MGATPHPHVQGADVQNSSLARADTRLLAAVSGSSLGLAIVDRELRLLESNPSFQRVVATTPDPLRILPVSLLELLNPDDHEPLWQVVNSTLAGHLPAAERVCRRVQSEEQSLHLRLSVLAGGAGMLVEARDIAGERHTHESLQRLVLMFDSISDGVILIGVGGSILDLNPAAAQIVGYTRSELLGRHGSCTMPAEAYRQLERQISGALSRNGRWQGEVPLLRQDGREVNCECVIVPLLSGAAEYRGAVVLLRDASERRTLEAQLRQAQKMEAVGRLAGGIAHDFNNLLTVINGYTELLCGDGELAGRARNRVGEIKKAAERATGLTRQLLAFSRRQVLSPRLLDLNAVVENLAPMLRRLIGENIDLSLRPVEGPLWLKADVSQIEQAILNLVVNARDAIAQSGRIEIATWRYTSRTLPASVAGILPAGSYASLAVADSGVGMDPETQSHIFEPFFTTKEAGHGTGLGLAMVYGVVRQSDGHIFVESEPGRGSTFTMYLPLSSPEEGGSEAPALVVEQPSASAETILVVEDEQGVRALICEMLLQQGYTVLESESSPDAIMLASHHPGTIHLMITDVIMPRMGGRELAQRMASVRPRMKVLYISGYTDDAVVRHGVRESQVEFLQKPFTSQALLHRVREILDAHA